MSRGSKRRRVPPSVAARSQQRQVAAATDQRWWWIGGGVVVVLLIAVALWFTVGPGKPASPTPTVAGAFGSDATPGATAVPVTTQAPTQSSGEESSPMPANPVERNDMYSAPPVMQIDPTKSYVATISTAKGDIVVQLDASAAPQTVNNFVFLSREGFYDGMTFHRVVSNFVIQGGDPLGSGGGGPGYKVPAEIGLPHVDVAIAMARQADEVNPERASSGSQFYITLRATTELDGAYTVFGQVTEGRDVVHSIAIGDVIESIKIVEE